MNRILITCLCLALLQATSVHAAVMAEGVPSSAYEAYAASFPEVGGFLATTTDGGSGLMAGSGVLIAPQWVITAGHVIDKPLGPNLGTVNGLSFSFNPSIFSTPSNAIVADQWFVNPLYIPNGSVTQPTDLALVHLSVPVVGVTPANLSTSPLATGMPVSMVGYGTPGYDSTGLLPYDGLKRGGTNLITGFGGEIPDSANYLAFDPIFAFTQFDNFFDVTALEYQASKFDSGGGIFLEDGSLAGIMIFGTGPQTPGNFVYSSTGFIDLSHYHDWIAATMASVPEPSTCLLVTTACAALAGLKRRQRSRS